MDALQASQLRLSLMGGENLLFCHPINDEKRGTEIFVTQIGEAHSNLGGGT